MTIVKTKETAIQNSKFYIDKWQYQDTIWMLSLFGTAIGAGILFLPIEAGINGLWPLLIMLFLAFPMTYLSHQALCRFVLASNSKNNDITKVVDEYFGPVAGGCLTFLYFFAIYPVLLMYSVAITNTTTNFLINQMHVQPWPRPILAILLLTFLMLIIRFGQDTIVKTMSILVYPFIIIIIILALYLIPYWNSAIFTYSLSSYHQDYSSLLLTIWMIIPIMVFSFNHSPIISSFAVAQKEKYGANADKKCSWILRRTHIFMISIVMFFVFSCVLSLSPNDLALAKQQNITILSYLANHFHTPIISYLGPVIAFIAIAKSFLGHYLGAQEGLHQLILKSYKKISSPKYLIYIVDFFIILSCWLIATINPSILKIIEVLSGPIIAIFLFLMPMYAIMTVPLLKKYFNFYKNTFVIIIGTIAISALLYGMF